MFTILFLHPGLAEAGRESGEMLRQMKELSASARAANHIRKVRYSVIQIPATIFFTCCHYWTQACSHIIGYIPGLFAIAPTHILEWQFYHPFMHLGIEIQMFTLSCI